MSQIVTDEEMRKVLANARNEMELRDINGRVLGLFIPLAEQYAAASASVPDDEEMRRVREEMKDRSKWMTTREAIEFLESRHRSRAGA